MMKPFSFIRLLQASAESMASLLGEIIGREEFESLYGTLHLRCDSIRRATDPRATAVSAVPSGIDSHSHG
jgi:hypothetical protein